MRQITADAAKRILAGETDAATLMRTYPEYRDAVLSSMTGFHEGSGAGEIAAWVDAWKARAGQAGAAIRKSGANPHTVDAFLPEIIKARIALHLLEQAQAAARPSDGKDVRPLGTGDGTLMQYIFFEKALIRKAVPMAKFRLLWPLVRNKRRLMPLVQRKGIYCYYSDRLIGQVADLIGSRPFVEIGAGDGALTRLLRAAGAEGTATDDYSWAHYIDYPESVLRMDAQEALRRLKPVFVLCSWPPPGNRFERMVFQTGSVEAYLVIGSRNPLVCGDFEAYHAQGAFTMEERPDLARWVLPPAKDHAVYLLHRKQTERSGGQTHARGDGAS
mgnify:CR=1 FL=1